LSKGILTAVCFCIFLPALTFAQGNNSGNLTVRSEPPGALVELKGEATVTGIAPTTFRYPFSGSYELKVSKYGYEDYRTQLILDPYRLLEVDVTLSPKTRFKAAVRSILLPGWGQKYAQRDKKALTFAFLAVGTGVAYLIADHNFDIKFDRYEEQLHTYDSALANGASYDEMQQRLDLLLGVQEEACDWEDVRRVTVGAAVAVWGLSILDALLSCPGEKGTFSVEGISIEPTARDGRFGLMCSRRF